MVIDGNSLINRAFYAFGGGGAGGELSYSGVPTNATYGFLNMLFRSIDDIKPTHIIVAFDVKGKTFRHEQYKDYKATRKGMPDELAVQLSDLKELLVTMGIKLIEKKGFEADDLIGTLVSSNGFDSVILTADRDAFQLINKNTELHLTKTGVTNTDRWTQERVIQEYGIEPRQMIEVKALTGDTSDNVPGAKGIGEKTALELVRKFQTVENLYNNLGEVKPATAEKLASSKQAVLLSRDLVTINTSVPHDVDLDETRFSLPLGQESYNAFMERGFKSFAKRANLWSASVNKESTKQRNQSRVETMVVTDIKSLVNKMLQEESVAIVYDQGGFYIACEGLVQYKIPIRQNLIDDGFDFEEILVCLKPLFESSATKRVFDSKEFKEILARYKISLNNVTIDAKICDHLLSTRTSYSSFSKLLPEYRLDEDSGSCALFRLDFLERLDEKKMLSLYKETELPLVDVLLGIQSNGAKINLEEVERAFITLQEEIESVSAQIHAQAGEVFNVNSPKALSEILFRKLGIQTLNKTKTGFSTNEEVLQKLRNKHPIVPQVLRYRKIHKLFSTYVQGYKNLASESGFVHSKFHNTATVTGRLSSSEPNLQNIPARSEDANLIRRFFASRFSKGKLLCADYSQIELRILAHLSGDETMIEAFKNGRDIHTETAVKVFGVPVNLVGDDMRRHAKAVNFGIIYGMGSFGLSQSIGVPVSEAGRFIEKYFDGFPKIKAFLDSCRDRAIENGFVSTLFGRRRYLPEMKSSNAQVVAFGTRAAMNMPMQGSAADIIKRAMVEIDKRMREKNLKSVMIAQIHDELVFDTTEDEGEILEIIVRQEMEGVIQLSVPLKVDISLKNSL